MNRARRLARQQVAKQRSRDIGGQEDTSFDEPDRKRIKVDDVKQEDSVLSSAHNDSVPDSTGAWGLDVTAFIFCYNFLT